MITKRVWDEMHKAKSYLLQIEIYGNRMRRLNRRVSIAIVVTSLGCAISAFFPDYNWCTVVTSVIVALSTIAKECLPTLVQPESELKELEEIRHFYKEYLQKLEKLFTERFDEKSDVDDGKMTDRFNRIIKTENDNESRLDIITRKLSQKERDIIREQSNAYFNRIYKGMYG